MDDLPLQVGKIDHVVVDHTQRADARGGEILQQGRAKAAGANHQYLRGDQPRLAHAADLGQHDMSRVPPDLHFRHVGQRRHGPLIAWDAGMDWLLHPPQ